MDGVTDEVPSAPMFLKCRFNQFHLFVRSNAVCRLSGAHSGDNDAEKLLRHLENREFGL